MVQFVALKNQTIAQSARNGRVANARERTTLAHRVYILIRDYARPCDEAQPIHGSGNLI